MKVCKRGHEREDSVNRCSICKREYDARRYLAGAFAARQGNRLANIELERVKDRERYRAKCAADQQHSKKKLGQLLAWKAANPEASAEAPIRWYRDNRTNVLEKRKASCATLADAYVARTLKIPSGLAPLQLIELKREQLRLKRLSKQIKEFINKEKEPA